MHVISFASLCESTRGTSSPLHSSLFPDLFISSENLILVSLYLFRTRERALNEKKRRKWRADLNLGNSSVIYVANIRDLRSTSCPYRDYGNLDFTAVHFSQLPAQSIRRWHISSPAEVNGGTSAGRRRFQRSARGSWRWAEADKEA